MKFTFIGINFKEFAFFYTIYFYLLIFNRLIFNLYKFVLLLYNTCFNY